ncbi:hypothetical protein PR202_gb05987 [Eleusine coracana subsp. coracana]|uniref:Uncharacterized protein n=1 Tax=Eleusine coracana subsp. coracana TaxID=191504 RepID=A0AAV5E8Q7_ELECO|nr:hypothetical protein PR202_gb05987 [Eleusine coracana subsp. coracana]
MSPRRRSTGAEAADASTGGDAMLWLLGIIRLTIDAISLHCHQHEAAMSVYLLCMPQFDSGLEIYRKRERMRKQAEI